MLDGPQHKPKIKRVVEGKSNRKEVDIGIKLTSTHLHAVIAITNTIKPISNIQPVQP